LVNHETPANDALPPRHGIVIKLVNDNKELPRGFDGQRTNPIENLFDPRAMVCSKVRKFLMVELSETPRDFRRQARRPIECRAVYVNRQQTGRSTLRSRAT
jgi:hypothetical protein